MKKFLTYIPRIDDGVEIKDACISNGAYLIGCMSIHLQHQNYEVFVDGELYNMDEICAELDLKSRMIEEVVLHAWLTWGENAMQKMEGAYAFVILSHDTCICVKDPMGLSPLYYLENESGVWVSNTIDTLLEHNPKEAVMDINGIRELIAFGPGIHEEKTLFQHIKAIPMGSMLIIKHEQCTLKRYFILQAQPHRDDLETTVKKVHDMVEESVLKQMKDCHASFLSGGLDSSIITSICARQEANWHTYALDYEGNAENFKGNMYQVSLDKAFIDDMIQYCDCKHRDLLISQQELCDKLYDAMLARSQPGMADVDSSLLWLCEQVAKHETVILSGECSDELMGGYPWFYREEFKDVHTFPWLRYVESRVALLNKDLQTIDVQGYIDECYKTYLDMVDVLESDSYEDKKARINTVLVLHWFMQSLVNRQVCEGDKAHLKIRAPFANVKLLQYVYNIPWSMKFYKDEEKGILRKAFEDELPESVAHRKKNPFPKTHNPLYADIIASKLKKRFDDPNSALHILFDDDKLKELLDTKGASYPLPFYGQLMSGPQLMAYIYQIDCWIEAYHIHIEI